MKYDDLETLKLKMVRILADRPGGQAPKELLPILCQESFGPNMEFFDEVLASLVKSSEVRFLDYEYESKSYNVYQLVGVNVKRYGITHIKPYFTYISQNYTPTKYVNIVNSAGVIVGTKKAMTKGELRTTLAGICIITIIGILVAIFIFL